MKNLNEMKVQEISINEQKEMNGGWIWPTVLAVGLYVLAEWDDLEAGFTDGRSGADANYVPR